MQDPVPRAPESRRRLGLLLLAGILPALVAGILGVALLLRPTSANPIGTSGGSLDAPFVYDPPSAAPLLRLTDQQGKPFSLTQLRGTTVLLSFGYTHCPDICPTTLAIDRTVLQARPGKTEVVFVTVDPARDTPEALATYLAYYAVPMVGLTGSDAAIAQAARAWGVGYDKGPVDASGNYAMDHTAGTFVIDPQGDLRDLYPYDTPATDLIAAVDGFAQ